MRAFALVCLVGLVGVAGCANGSPRAASVPAVHTYLAQTEGRIAWLQWVPGPTATAGTITTVAQRADTPLYLRTSTVRFTGRLRGGSGVLRPASGDDAWPVVVAPGGLAVRWNDDGIDRSDTFAAAGVSAYDGATQALDEAVGRMQAALQGQGTEAAAVARADQTVTRAAQQAAKHQAALAKVFADRTHAAAMRKASAHARAERVAAAAAAAHDAATSTSTTVTTVPLPSSVPPPVPSTPSTGAGIPSP